ncbi:hypothetical protein [Hoeflea sp.]|uniref:hypothetical protein n=1 Tax=Hoeflea sp. TaxID=1940281 RepID=UPI003B020F21
MRKIPHSAVRNLASSALQPDFRILWKVSIFQRMAYQSSFSMASLWEYIGRLVISFQSIPNRPKYLVSAERDADGRGYKFPAENVALYLLYS